MPDRPTQLGLSTRAIEVAWCPDHGLLGQADAWSHPSAMCWCSAPRERRYVVLVDDPHEQEYVIEWTWREPFGLPWKRWFCAPLVDLDDAEDHCEFLRTAHPDQLFRVEVS